MNTKKIIPLEQFTVHIFKPTNRSTIKTIVIHESGQVNINGKLAQVLGGKDLTISFTSDAKHILLCERNDGELIHFTKRGVKRLAQTISLLKEQKIFLPATYEVWKREEDGYWQGDLIPNPTASPSKGRRSSKKN